MKKADSPYYLARHSPWSTLLLLEYLSSYLCYLLFLSSAFFISCSGPLEENPEEPSQHCEQSAETKYSSLINITGGGLVDLFIYGSGPGATLEDHCRFKSSGDTSVTFCGSGDKTAVVIADFPFDFNMATLQKPESLELLEMELEDDRPEAPVRSGIGEFTAGQDCDINPTPLLCTIELSLVRNLGGRQFLLENPCIFLSGANNSVELFRFSGFRQKSYCTDTLRTPLSQDIGIPDFFPDARLYCYPNDDPLPGLGNSRTTFVLECRINGVRCEFPAPLPPMGRGAGMKVSFEIRSASDYSYSIF